jgi:hypothetical protein
MHGMGEGRLLHRQEVRECSLLFSTRNGGRQTAPKIRRAVGCSAVHAKEDMLVCSTPIMGEGGG